MTDLEQLQALLIQGHAMQEEEKRVSARLGKLKTDMRQLELAALVLMKDMGLDALSHAGVVGKRKDSIHYHAATGDGWQRIYDRILRTQEFDLLHKRLSSTAVRERFKNDDRIDGVEEVSVPSLVLTLDPTYLRGE
jgi:hypothetical protein